MLIIGHVALTTFVLYVANFIRRRRDFTIAFFGSLLPDLIDKPLGFLIFQGFGNGRLVAHTLLFNVLMLLIFLVFRSNLQFRLGGNPVILPVASMLHLAEDRMWEDPSLLLFPFMGDIPLKPTLTLIERIYNIINSYRNPYIFLSEMIGAILLYFLYKLYRRVEN
ncbi:metal-dependent hydrolase [Ferroglobus sp.]|uniref:metal-dependent hydrolase n=1 Tax=Ferroglobus sp. TaxID=2614230 RepID=UPI0025B95C85|nr:metal-dependent hydrolase [Ferroglobus sp.]